MSFKRIRRVPANAIKPFPVAPNGIVLAWKDDPPSPCLTIYVGWQLGQALDIDGKKERAQLLLGRGVDQRKCAIRFVSGRDWDYRVQRHPHGFKVHLPSHISVAHFNFCPRTAIAPDAIEIVGDLVVFAYEGLIP